MTPAPSGQLRKCLDWLYWLAGALAALCVFLIFVLMITASLGRIFNFPVGAINDIVAWLCAAAAFFAMADAFRNGDFVRVTLLLEKLPPRPRRALEVFSLVVATVSIAYLFRWAASYTWESYQFNDIANGMVALPLWIPQLAFVFGALLFLVAVVDELLVVLAGGKPAFERAVEERHARGDFSADI